MVHPHEPPLGKDHDDEAISPSDVQSARKQRQGEKCLLHFPWSCERKPDDADMPAIDKERLRRLEYEELSEQDRNDVLRLIATYRSWWLASGQVIEEELRKQELGD